MADIATLGLKVDATQFVRDVGQATQSLEKLDATSKKVSTSEERRNAFVQKQLALFRQSTRATETQAKANEAVATKSNAAAAGTARLNTVLVSYIARVTGASASTIAFAVSLASLAASAAVITGVLAAMALIGKAWDEVSKTTRKAREELEKARAVLQAIGRENALGPGGETGASLAMVAARRDAVARQIAELEGRGGSGQSGVSLRIAKLKEEYEQLVKEVEWGEARVAEAERREQKEGMDRILKYRALALQEQKERYAEEEKLAKEHARIMVNYLMIGAGVTGPNLPAMFGSEGAAAYQKRQEAAARAPGLLPFGMTLTAMHGGGGGLGGAGGMNQATNAVSNVLIAFAGDLQAIGHNVVAALSSLLDGIQDEKNRQRYQSYLASAGVGYGVGYSVGSTTTSRTKGAIGGGISGAAAGFMVAGPVGAVIGGITGAIGGWLGASKKAKEAAEEAKRIEEALYRQRQQEAEDAKQRVRDKEDYVASLSAREKMLAAADDNERTRVQAAITRDQKLTDTARMLEDGMISAQDATRANALAQNEYATELLKVEEAAKAAAKAARDVTDALVADLVARGLSATGQSRAAEDVRREFGYARERAGAANQSPAVQALLDLVQNAERSEIAFNRRMEDLQTSMADALSAYDHQIQIAEDQLRVSESQLRAQEQTVAQIRQVVDNLTDYSKSMLIGSGSPLSPFAQLQEARSQFDAMAALAMGGDLTAAQSLPGAAQALLGASRGYNASGAGYVADFQNVQAVVAAVTERFATQLTTEEKILAELVKQTSRLQTQINQLVAERDSAQARYADEIAKLQDEWDKERARWAALLAFQANLVSINQRIADGLLPGDPIWPPIDVVLSVGLEAIAAEVGSIKTAIKEQTADTRRAFEVLGV